MNSDIETKLDRALSGTAFSVQEKEHMLASILGDVETDAVPNTQPAPRRQWFKPWAWIGVPALCAAAAVGFFWFTPVANVSLDNMAARGSAEGANNSAIALSLRCDGQISSQCAHGQEIQLAIGPLAKTAFAAVVAVDDEDILTWFYPDASGNSLQIFPGQLSSVALKFDTTAQPGSYRVFVLVYDEPPSRDLVRARFTDDETGSMRASANIGLIQLLLGAMTQKNAAAPSHTVSAPGED